MGKLLDIVKNSKINKIKIEFNGEKFNFNLVEELSISQSKLNSELKDQPSYYGFLLLLRNKLLTVRDDKERLLDQVSAGEYKKLCETTNPKTNRLYADKTAKELVFLSPKYNKAKEEFLKARQDYNDINSCVLAFEQRSTLIQTLAANIRKENL